MNNQVVILTFLTDPARHVRYLGPYQVAWFIRQYGYTAQVLDFLYFMTKEQRMNLYQKFISEETKIVGFAPFLMPGIGQGQKLELGLEVAVDILTEIRDNFPWVNIIVGGQTEKWFTYMGYKNFPVKVDAVFQGEGEHTLLEYCDHVYKKAPHPAFTIVNGMKIIRASKQYDMSTCGMRFEKQDFVLPGESLPMEFSRGCVFKCRFCQYPNIGKDKDDFNKPIEYIRDTLIHNYEQFGTTRYHISDDTLNAHRERTKAFHAMTKTLPFKIEFLGYVRLDLLDIWPEQQDLLPDSGLVSAHFGIESFNADSCKMIGKGWGAKNHKPWLTKINQHWGDSVILNCSLIAGLGTETIPEWEETLAWFESSKIHDYFYQPLHLSKVLMLSDFERNAEKYGYTWPNPIAEPWYWKNSVTDCREAVNWCQTKMVTEKFKKRVPSVWNFASLRNQQFSKDEILKGNYIDLHDIRKAEDRLGKFVNEYHALAMNYEGE